MLFRIDPFAPAPAFEQLAFQVKVAVARGELRPGDRLPSVRELAQDVGINPNTVVRALEILERDRVIVRRQGAGCFVSEPSSDLSAAARKATLEQLMERAATEAFHLGFSAKAVRAALDAALERVHLPAKERRTS